MEIPNKLQNALGMGAWVIPSFVPTLPPLFAYACVGISIGFVLSWLLEWLAPKIILKKETRLIISLIIFAVGVATMLGGGLWYWSEIKPATDSSNQALVDTKPSVNISGSQNVLSVGQSGGMTAHTINIEDRLRALSAGQKATLIAKLSPLATKIKELNIKVDIIKLNGPEAADYATQWEQVFKASGWPVVNEIIDMSSTWRGMLLQVNNSAVPGGANLQQAISEVGITCESRTNEKVHPNSIQLTIGFKEQHEPR